MVEHSVPKATLKMAAAPECSTSEHSKASWTVRNSSFSTTTLPTEIAGRTVTVPDYGGPNKREPEHIAVDKWLQPAEFKSWKFRSRSEVYHSSQYLRAAFAMGWSS